jgi:hypothetical protein
MMTHDELIVVVENVRKLARDYPEARYNQLENEHGSMTCFYEKGTVDDGPATDGCIVGQAWRDSGLEPLVGQETIANELYVRGISQDVELARWLSLVQQYQDDGMAWSRAVEEADAHET